MKTRYFLMVLVFVFLQFTGFVHGTIPESERAALIALYNSTNGDNWVTPSFRWKIPPLHTDGFSMPGTEGNWYGIYTGTANEHVLQIDLRQNRLIGSIPPEIGNLSQVVWIWMYGNELSGTIPSEIGNLGNLTKLHLEDNLLSGTIPSSFTNLTKITLLFIGHNCLTATDPSLRAWLNSHDPDWEAHQNECSGVIITPTITTNPVSSITQTSAVCGGNVTSDGGASVTTRGVCWSTAVNPTISHSKTTNGAGTGSFTSSITGLSANTPYYVRAYASNSKGTSYGANQMFTTLGSGTPVIGLSRTTLNFGGTTSGIVTNAQMVLISNSGSGTLNWSAASNASWLTVTPASGTGDTLVSISVNPAGLFAGTHNGTITITDPNASNSPQTISVELQVYNQGSTTVPFGEFATPVEGATTYSSIPVTGWALDDIGVASIKIYNGDSYVGDAVFVEGARPDVQTAYPNYPNNYKAGWGYMLLTHFLPGGGNGTYTLVAKAMDMEGNEIVLGSKTITIDNAHAVKPFGAIDSPTQGGTASGSAFRNNGWALTPMPNNIPTNGSTINVYIDGGLLGHANYNLYRADIAQLFPGYVNSNNAWGYYDIDTTKYSNGLHTIQWTAADNAGNSDGIGSRYFTIQNTSSDVAQSTATPSTKLNLQQISTLPEDSSEPIYFSTGFHSDNECSELLPDEKGNNPLTINELERVEIQLGQNYTAIQGYLISGNQLNPLPIGSTLDAKRGVFSWSPGPGFIGNYSLVFVLTDANGLSLKKAIEIKIEPKFGN